jgi:hypothetical protein
MGYDFLGANQKLIRVVNTAQGPIVLAGSNGKSLHNIVSSGFQQSVYKTLRAFMDIAYGALMQKHEILAEMGVMRLLPKVVVY